MSKWKQTYYRYLNAGFPGWAAAQLANTQHGKQD